MIFRPALLSIVALLGLNLVGCATGYKDFYRPINGATPEMIAARRSAPPPATPAVEHAQPGSGQLIADAYMKRGYGLIGQSNFNSGRGESDGAAVRQAQEVGADLVVIMDPKYTGSVTTSVPLTLPTSSTARTSGTATAYGAGGAVTAYGNSTSTTYGTTTSYIPMTVNRSDYAAMYFVKMKASLGISGRDLNDEERQQLQTNKGIVVRLVTDGSPAYEADILVGDIIVMLDGQSVPSSGNFSALIREKAGQKITLSLVRKGQHIEKTIQLGS